MYKFFKRVSDIISASIALIILSPILLPIVIGLRLTGEGYVFYKQERVGFKNKLFRVFKFATMLKESLNMAGGAITTTGDSRITPMGGFLRKTKINELPQLLNILFGDMSVVGPRPVIKKQSFDHYPEDVKEVIYNVRPGLTGIGSLIFRDEEELITQVKNKGGDTLDFYKFQIYPHKGQLEKWYQRNQSFIVDLKIILATAWAVVNPKTDIAYQWFKSLPKRNF